MYSVHTVILERKSFGQSNRYENKLIIDGDYIHCYAYSYVFVLESKNSYKINIFSSIYMYIHSTKKYVFMLIGYCSFVDNELMLLTFKA